MATRTELRIQIEAAFADTPHPGRGFADISASADDEGIVAYFATTTWRGHQVNDLRRYDFALSFFTERAFRYWLPAFMLAELDDSRAADVIAESIAYALGKSDRAAARLQQFSVDELEAIAAFLADCAPRYAAGAFRVAARAVGDALAVGRTGRGRR